MVRGRPRGRRGAALVELAVVLPLLLFLLVAGTDFARAYRDLVIVTDLARNVGVAASQFTADPSATKDQNDAAWRAAILKAITAASSKPSGGTPMVVFDPGKFSAVPASDPYITVTVSSLFRTILAYPGIPSSCTIRRSVRMRLQPPTYRMQ